MPRRPRGYEGIDHQTIGSDLLAVYKTLKLPDQILGEAEAARLAEVDPAKWYPIAWLLELMETLDERVGQYGLLRMGRTIFKLSHQERVVKEAHSAHDIIYGIDGMYHFSNRGEKIGGWRVVKFDPGHAELEKNTPHHCMVEQGILSEALTAVGCPGTVSQRQCFREGAETCIYTITSAHTDARWSGEKA